LRSICHLIIFNLDDLHGRKKHKNIYIKMTNEKPEFNS
jgi:hypothetical protein